MPCLSASLVVTLLVVAVALLAGPAAAQNASLGLGVLNCQPPPAATCVRYQDVGARTGEQCGLCYQGLKSASTKSTQRINANRYCADKNTACLPGNGFGVPYPICIELAYVQRGDLCQTAPTATVPIPAACEDDLYSIGCLPVEKVCGSGTVFDAGADCSVVTDFNDFTRAPSFGCSQNICLNGRCNSTATACAPAATGGAGVPPLPSQYCDFVTQSPAVAVPRLSVGADCTNTSAATPCVWNAACVSDGDGKSTCVRYGTATEGQPCVAQGVCTGDLACVPVDGKLRCVTPKNVGGSCSFGSPDQCDSATGSTQCLCDSTTGESICNPVNWGVPRTMAWQAYADCVAENGCTFIGQPYYSSCVDTHCRREYKKFTCAKPLTLVRALKADNRGKAGPCSGAPSASLLLSGAAMAVLALAMAL